MNISKNILQTLKIIVLAVALSFGLSYVYAWTAPTLSAPGGNTSAPLNTSINDQTKTGGLGIAWLGANTIDVVGVSAKITAPQYCIGTSCITVWPVAGGVSSFNGATGAVTGVSSFNGATGAVTVTGMSGILMPLSGKTITTTCTNVYTWTAYAKVDTSGNPYTRVTNSYPGQDSGWVAGFYARVPGNGNRVGQAAAVWTIGNFPNLSMSAGCSATANWPMN